MINIIVIIVILIFLVIQQTLIIKGRKKRHQIGHDELTGLCNKEHLIQKAKVLYKTGRPRCVIYSNIAEFKLINELFGREKGNEILKKQAEQLRKYAKKGDLYARAGEDHFIMIIDQKDFHEEYLYDCSKELQELLSDSIYNVRVLFGIYKTAHFNESIETMCDKAALAIDSIGENAQDIVGYYDDSMLENALQWKRVVDEFENALEKKEFEMYLQPQIDAKTGNLYGAEALVRRKVDGKIIPPVEFIPIYEKTGLICKMDQFIWEQAAKQLSEWKAAEIERNISVNISPKDFSYIDILTTFKNLVRKYQIAPENLNIEITETMIMSEIPNLREDLQQLRNMGFRVEIDDFGSGYSSLNALKDIDVDVLKIDMGFLGSTENEKKSQIILSSVIRMAKEIGMSVIAEGVETKEQVEMLCLMGCDIFQGYYYSKPVSVEEFEKIYQEKKGKQKKSQCA